VLVAGADTYGMASPLQSIQRPGGAARSAVAGTIVMAFGFFDRVFLGAPIALLAAALRPVPLYCGAVIAVILLVIGCCRWVDRRWDDWFAGKGRRIETRLEAMRASRLMRHPVAWIQRGSDRWYALAAAVANPILVAGVARFLGGKQIGERRIVLGAVAYAIPYVAMWMIVGLVVSGSLRAL
jgi:hypothetical protein